MSPPLATAKSALKITNDSDWSVRGDYWLKKLNPVSQYKPRKRRKTTKPIVLRGHGIRLKVEADILLISCGFTHYPQSREQYRFFQGDRQLPSRIVIIDGDGSITLDALEWLSGQGVPLVQIDWKGNVSSLGGAAYAANTNLVKRQLSMQSDGSGFEYFQTLVIEKLVHCCDTIQSVEINNPDIDSRLNTIQEYIKRIRDGEFESAQELRNAEALAAVAYFKCWYHYELRWRGIKRKPIKPAYRVCRVGDIINYRSIKIC